MKKFLFCALAFGMVACAKDATEVNEGPAGVAGETNYLSVSIVSASSTRAEYTENGGTYEDGTTTENTVTSVRFYFFDGDTEAANAMPVRRGGVKYYDVTEISGNGTDHPNSVERILDAVAVIETAEGDGLPVTLTAVLNIPEAYKAELNNVSTLGELNAVIKALDLEATDNMFVMSTAVYAENPGVAGAKKVETVAVAGHLYPDVNAAKANPVVIYVERVVAKVTLATTLTAVTLEAKEGVTADNTNIFDTQKTVNNVVGGEPVYVKFIGWNATATANVSYLMKNINPAWDNTASTSNLFQTVTEPWNWAGHRSFWSINPTTGFQVQYGPFRAPLEGEVDAANPNIAGAITDFVADETNPKNLVYVQENAGNGDTFTTTPTEVIIAAQLVDKYGDALEIAEYGGVQYTDKDDVLDLIANAASLYKEDGTEQVGDEQRTKFTKIVPTEIEFKTATVVDGAGAVANGGRYYVYAQLKTAGTWYDAKPDYTAADFNLDTWKAEHTTNANDALKSLGHAKVWEGGKTYYFFKIRHLANPAGDAGELTPEDDKYDETLQASKEAVPGYYGVVRNHVYKNTVTTLFGLGTPVYDPDEVIIPEKPIDDDTVIAAQIKILSWRVVNNGVELEWK